MTASRPEATPEIAEWADGEATLGEDILQATTGSATSNTEVALMELHFSNPAVSLHRSKETVTCQVDSEVS